MGQAADSEFMQGLEWISVKEQYEFRVRRMPYQSGRLLFESRETLSNDKQIVVCIPLYYAQGLFERIWSHYEKGEKQRFLG